MKDCIGGEGAWAGMYSTCMYKRTAMQSRELSGNSYPIRGVCTLAHSQLVGMFVLIESIPHT